MQWKSLILAAAIVAVVFAVPTRAHHSHNAYEVLVWTNLEGTIKELHMVVPHSWVYMDVKDAKGEVTTWALEAAGPNAIMANGVKKGDVQGRRQAQSAVPSPQGRLARMSSRVHYARSRRSGARPWRRARVGLAATNEGR